jgi:hypothetical protein
LPGPVHVTLWRSKPQGVVGAFAGFRGSEGALFYERLLADRDAIDREFDVDGVPAPEWQQDRDGASIGVTWPSAWPWDEAEEDRQMELMAKAANRFVNSLRPRIEVTA